MLLHDSKRTSIFVFPPVATTAVILFLLRHRQVTDISPGSGVTIAGAELLVRVSALAHAAVSVGAQGFSLLMRIATAPAIFVFTTLESEYRVGLGAIDDVGSFLQHAAVHLIQAL